MAKLKEKIDINSGQSLIFEIIGRMEQERTGLARSLDFPGSLNLDPTIRELISDSLKKTTLNRYEVASEMSRLLGREITKAMIDSWSAESKEQHRFPLAYLNAFIKATGTKDILCLICNNANGYFIENEDALRIQLSKLNEQKRELVRQERMTRRVLASLEKRGK